MSLQDVSFSRDEEIDVDHQDGKILTTGDKNDEIQGLERGIFDLKIIDDNTGRKRTLTEKGLEYQMNLYLGNRKKTLLKLKRKSTGINGMLYSSKNYIAVQEELEQYNGIFKLLISHHKEMMKLLLKEEEIRNEEEWFESLDKDVFNFKHMVHNWLKEAEQERSVTASSKKSIKSSPSGGSSVSHTSKKSVLQKVMEEKMKLAELDAEASLIEQKQEVERLQMTEKVAKAKTRAKVMTEFETQIRFDQLPEGRSTRRLPDIPNTKATPTKRESEKPMEYKFKKPDMPNSVSEAVLKMMK